MCSGTYYSNCIDRSRFSCEISHCCTTGVLANMIITTLKQPQRSQFKAQTQRSGTRVLNHVELRTFNSCDHLFLTMGYDAWFGAYIAAVGDTIVGKEDVRSVDQETRRRQGPRNHGEIRVQLPPFSRLARDLLDDRSHRSQEGNGVPAPLYGSGCLNEGLGSSKPTTCRDLFRCTTFVLPRLMAT